MAQVQQREGASAGYIVSPFAGPFLSASPSQLPAPGNSSSSSSQAGAEPQQQNTNRPASEQLRVSLTGAGASDVLSPSGTSAHDGLSPLPRYPASTPGSIQSARGSISGVVHAGPLSVSTGGGGHELHHPPGSPGKMLEERRRMEQEVLALRKHLELTKNELHDARQKHQAAQKEVEQRGRALASLQHDLEALRKEASERGKKHQEELDRAKKQARQDEEARGSLRLAKAEKALEQERQGSEELRRRVAAQQAAAEQGGRALAQMKQLQQELQEARAQLVLRNTEAEVRQAKLGEAEATIGRLREQLADLVRAGRMTLAEEQELEGRLGVVMQDSDSLKGQLESLKAREEEWMVKVRAAEDRAQAAEEVSLDMQRKCEAAAGTISRLIDENNALIVKINLQAMALTEFRCEVAKRDMGIAALEGMLMQARSASMAPTPATSAGGAAVEAPAGAPPGSAMQDSAMQDSGAPVAPASPDQAPGLPPISGTATPTAGCETSMNVSSSPPTVAMPPEIASTGGRWGSAPSSGDAMVDASELPGGLTEQEWQFLQLQEEVQQLQAALREARAAAGMPLQAGSPPQDAAEASGVGSSAGATESTGECSSAGGLGPATPGTRPGQVVLPGTALSTPLSAPNTSSMQAGAAGQLAQFRQLLPPSDQLGPRILELAHRMVELEEELAGIKASAAVAGAAAGLPGAAAVPAPAEQLEQARDPVATTPSAVPEAENASSEGGASDVVTVGMDSQTREEEGSTAGVPPAAGHAAKAPSVDAVSTDTAPHSAVPVAQPVQGGPPSNVTRQDSSDIDDLIISPDVKPKKRRVGFWSWLTGQDAVSVV